MLKRFGKRGLKMNKDGEITMQYLIALILAIVGFIIVIILLFSLEFESLQTDEICKLSVLTRATSPTSAQGFFPLKCTTAKICLTEKRFGGECEQFLGEKNVREVVLTGSVENKAEIIERVNAEAMYSCWNMMGQGKLDIFRDTSAGFFEGVITGDNLRKKKASCVICSRVALDKDFIYKKVDGKFVESENGFTDEFLSVAEKVDVNKYLENNGPANSEKNYLEVMTNDLVRSYPVEFSKDTSIFDKGMIGGVVDQRAFVFMQIFTEGEPLDAALETAGNVELAGQMGLYTIGGVKGLVNLPAQAVVAISSLGSGGIAYYQQKESRAVSAAYCGDFTSQREKGANGCSLVLPLDYDNIELVNSYCSSIDGSP